MTPPAIPSPDRRPRIRSILRSARWIGCLPAAFLAGGAAGALVDIMNRIAIIDYRAPGSPWMALYIACVPGLGAGAAGVYLASRLAPGARRPVAVFLAAASASVCFFPSLLFWSPEAIPPFLVVLSTLLGSGGMAFTIFSGELLPAAAIRRD